MANADKFFLRGLIHGIVWTITFIALLAIYVQYPIMTYSDYIEDKKINQQKIASLQSQLNSANASLTKYEADEAYIRALPGATEDVAQKIIKAAGALNIDPK